MNAPTMNTGVIGRRRRTGELRRGQQADLPVIAGVINGKGGSGKTTSVLGLAASAAGSGLETLVVDADWQQSSVALTGALLRPPKYTVIPAPDVASLRYLRDAEVDLVLIDTPGMLPKPGAPPSEESAAIELTAQYADVIIVPSDMSAMSSGPTMDTVDYLVRRGFTPNVLLNAISPGREKMVRATLAKYKVLADPEDDRSAVLQTGVSVLEFKVRRYVAHGHAVNDGVPITEWEGLNATAARTDLLAVLHEIARVSPALQSKLGGWR